MEAAKDYSHYFGQLEKKEEKESIKFLPPTLPPVLKQENLCGFDLHELFITENLGKFIDILNLLDDEQYNKIGRILEACIRDYQNGIEDILELISYTVGDIEVIQSTGPEFHERRVVGISFQPSSFLKT